MIKLNLNPRNIKAGDCVVRAIAYATQQSYDETYKGLFETGFKWKRLPNEKECYEKYLAKLGWIKVKQPRDIFNNKFTINDFISGFDKPILNKPYGDRVIISCANHLTCAEYVNDGKYEIIDTWDCGKKCVGNYWVKR